MSISIIIIGMLVIAMFILPFLLVGIGKNNGQKQLKRALYKVASDNNSTLSKVEFMSSSAIGIDENTNDLFFVQTYNGVETFKHLKLSKFKSCKINKYGREVKDREDNHTAIDRIDLELIPVEKGKSSTILEVFNAEGSVLYSNELAIVEIWQQIINEKLTIRKSK